MVFTTRFRAARRPQRLRTELRRLGIIQKNGRPNHPDHLRQSRTLPADPEERGSRPTPSPPPSPSCKPSSTSSPTTTTPNDPTARCPTGAPPPRPTAPGPKPHPPTRQHDTHCRVRHDRVDTTGASPCATTAASTTSASARHHAQPASSCSSTTSTSAIIDAATGELIRNLTLDPDRDYQPLGATRTANPKCHTARTN